MDDINDGGASFFGWIDYILFGIMLGISCLIGIYFSYWGKKEESPKEYLHGGKTMGALSVAVSLVVSSVSGITVVGDPAEIYSYGTLYTLHCISAVIVGFINNRFYLPVFYELQLTSTYEYLELRFNKSVRVMASLLNTISTILHLPIVVYVPALALGQVTGIDFHYIAPVITIFCVFYTVLGGIKAVVWTDFLQAAVMLMSSSVVIVLGLIQVGGFDTVWKRNNDGGRIRVFEMNPSPFERMTFWSSVIGSTVGWMCISVSQWTVQRFLAVPTYRKAQRLLVFYLAGLIIIKLLMCLTGLIMFANYYECDPIKTKAITKADQLLTYFVSEISSSIPGLYGLFVAGIFSASLSTLSTCLNSLGATVYEDCIKPFFKSNVSERTSSYIMRTIVLVTGIICVCLVFVVEKLGGILQLAVTAGGITSGATLGLFSFGMFYPRGNSKGVLAGSVISMLFMGWLVFGAQKLYADGALKYPSLATSVDGCPFNVTMTEVPTVDSSENNVFILFRVSFMYYTLMGFIILFVVGTSVSLITEAPNVEKVKPILFSPIVRKYVMNKQTNFVDAKVSQRLTSES